MGCCAYMYWQHAVFIIYDYKLVFDGNSVKEIITGWKKGEYLSYVALSGLGISAYHATISLKPVRGKTRITWESVFADKDGKIVENFKKEIGEFYSKSLRALRKGF